MVESINLAVNGTLMRRLELNTNLTGGGWLGGSRGTRRTCSVRGKAGNHEVGRVAKLHSFSSIKNVVCMKKLRPPGGRHAMPTYITDNDC